MEVGVEVSCGETEVCQHVQSKLNGLQCNGRLAAALSEAFETHVTTPVCPDDVYVPPAGAPGSVTFPEAFPNSVRHWLLIGCLSMMIGAACAIYLAFGQSDGAQDDDIPLNNKGDEKPKPLTLQMRTVLGFIVCAVAMVAYFGMWSGVWVEFKTSGSTPRVIFFPKYLDWIITTPLLVTMLGLVGKADTATLVAMVGNDVLMVLCWLVGATLTAPYKYVWWVLGVMFFIVVLLLVARVVERGRNSNLRTLGLILGFSWGVYPLLWVLGSEGTGALGLSQEVALTVLTDMVSKVLFTILIIIWGQEKDDL